jgi:hypothetical protein
MKTIFLIIVLTSLGFAQDVVISDSLKAGDSVFVAEMRYGFSMGEWKITANDTGTTYTDSVEVYSGQVMRKSFTSSRTNDSDTLWTLISVKKASDWEDYDVISGANSTTLWFPLSHAPRLLKLVLKNAEYVDGRRWIFQIEGKKEE